MDSFNYIKGKNINPSDKYSLIRKQRENESNEEYKLGPLLSETEIKTGTKDKIMYIDVIHIGQFSNFGYKDSYTNFNMYFRNFIESLHNHFVDIFARIKELQNNTSN